MRRLFLYSFASAFTIIGSIIGAGFVTGKEIYEFFAKDFSLCGLYLTFLCFSFTIYYAMEYLPKSSLHKWVEIFVSLANVIVAGCMLSALESVYKRVFYISENIKIFSIITAILLFVIAMKGIGWVEKFCTITLPFVIVGIILLCLTKVDDYSIAITPKSYLGVIKPFTYVGFNVVLSAGIIKNSGEKLTPLFKIVASLLTSAIICALVWLVSLTVQNEGKVSEMPFISLFITSKKLLKIIDIITLFAIYSTLISSLYTINRFGGIKLKIIYKIIMFLAVYLISCLGFSSIVERLYPMLGILAYLFIFTKFLLLTPFLKGRQERTSNLLKGRG